MTTTSERAAESAIDAAPQQKQFERLATAVDEAARAVEELDPAAREAAQRLRSAVEDAHREALTTIVRRLRADEGGREALYELVDEPLVHMLFLLHGIIRPDPMTLSRNVLDTVRPGLQSHGGDVELVSIEDGVAYVRLSGACNGCSMSSVTMRTTVEEALVSGVPAVKSVEVLPSEPTPTVIPLSAIGLRTQTPEEARAAGWERAAAASDIPDGEVSSFTLSPLSGPDVDVVVVRIGGSMTSYRDACAHQGLPLGGALLDTEAGTLTCQWHGFCYEALSGECVSSPGVALEQLPMRVDDGDVWIRVGT